MKRLPPIRASLKANLTTPRDGIVDPSKSPPGPCWDCLTPIAEDREALAVPFFSTRGNAAYCAAQMIVVHDTFGSHVRWAAVVEEHCYRFRPAVCIDPSLHCDAMDVLTSAVYGFTGVSRAGCALRSLDVLRQWDAPHTRDPDEAARVLVEAVLRASVERVEDIANRLLCAGATPLGRDDLLFGEGCQYTQHDPITALLRFACTDRDCEWSADGGCECIHP